MSSPKITVVTVCLNAADCIEKTIQSVVCQTYKNIEYIIIDGYSTDGTVDIIKKYENYVTRWISESDEGIYDAMNKGIDLASGEWINFMNAGDWFVNENVIADLLVKVSGLTCAVFFGDAATNKDGVMYREFARPFYDNLPLHQCMGFNHQCSFVCAEMAKKFHFNLKYHVAADYHMIISLYRIGAKFQQIDMLVAYYDTNGFSELQRNKHFAETLAIDYPNRKLTNVIVLFFKICHRWVIKMSKSVIYQLCPKVLEIRRRTNPRFVRLNLDYTPYK